MKRIFILFYGILAYLLFLATILYVIGFLNNIVVPAGIDQGATVSLSETLIVDLGLIALFGLAHSVMARKRFKSWWTRIIPKAAERSTYIIQASLLLILIMWQWRPIPDAIWSVENEFGRYLIQGIHGLGWIIVIVATFLINHFRFTGLKQVFDNLRGKQNDTSKFVTPFLYKIVRHPLQLGLLIAFWVTAEMTIGRLLFAAAMSVYILIGLYFEERDLVREFGETYTNYRETTPKLFPHRPVSTNQEFFSNQ